MLFNIKVLLILLLTKTIECSITGITYMDPLGVRRMNKTLNGDDPCHPLYWYPKHIPDYCFFKIAGITTKRPPVKTSTPIPNPKSIPYPAYIPLPLPFGIPFLTIPAPMPLEPPLIPSLNPFPPMLGSVPPISMPGYISPGLTSDLFPWSPISNIPPPKNKTKSPNNVLTSELLPNNTPLVEFPPFDMSGVFLNNPILGSYAPSPLNPLIPNIHSLPLHHQYISRRFGFVPPVPGIVSRDGGINILPFSDAYSQVLEQRKQRILTKRLQKVLKEYDDY